MHPLLRCHPGNTNSTELKQLSRHDLQRTDNAITART